MHFWAAENLIITLSREMIKRCCLSKFNRLKMKLVSNLKRTRPPTTIAPYMSLSETLLPSGDAWPTTLNLNIERGSLTDEHRPPHSMTSFFVEGREC